MHDAILGQDIRLDDRRPVNADISLRVMGNIQGRGADGREHGAGRQIGGVSDVGVDDVVFELLEVAVCGVLGEDGGQDGVAWGEDGDVADGGDEGDEVVVDGCVLGEEVDVEDGARVWEAVGGEGGGVDDVDDAACVGDVLLLFVSFLFSFVFFKTGIALPGTYGYHDVGSVAETCLDVKGGVVAEDFHLCASGNKILIQAGRQESCVVERV